MLGAARRGEPQQRKTEANQDQKTKKKAKSKTAVDLFGR
jgi:hypothetical protein